MSRPPSSPPRARLFPSCLGDRFFADAARDAGRLLRSLGVVVELPRGVACCGQPAWNAGYAAEARRVARHASAGLAGDVPVVLPSGSCAAMIRHRWDELDVSAPPVYELAEYVVEVLGVTELGTGLHGVRVAYHHGCHALRELGVREAPLRLLEAAGAEVVTWEAAEECCGFGGLFAVKLPWVSAAMADRKLDTLARARPQVLTSADGGCLLQLGGRAGVRARRQDDPGRGDGGAADGGPEPPRVVHLATLLLEARGRSPVGSGRAPRGGAP